jgi:hypothetical protein
MSGAAFKHRAMIEKVARALGADLLVNVAFLGGCATGLLVTDELTRESVRYTDDVDLVVEAVTSGQWAQFESTLRKLGFRSSPEDELICRMRLDTLIVDFMPTVEKVLGFTNRWYALALKTAEWYRLMPADLSIRLVTPPLFAATKLEAYRGRGQGNLLESSDIEDIINLFNGRDDIIQQITSVDDEVRRYIAVNIASLLAESDFEYAIQGNVRDAAREAVVFRRLEKIAAMGKT